MIESFELRVSGSLFAQFDAELRSGPRDDDEFEQAGFLFCGIARPEDRLLLVAQRWRSVPRAARVQRPDYGLAWSARFNAEVLDEADALHAAPVLIHRHEWGEEARLSRKDRATGDPMLARMSALADRGIAASVVLHLATAAGLFWSGGQLAGNLGRLRIVGAPLRDVYPTVAAPAAIRPRLHRQTLAIGPESDAKLARAKVAVVGLSGGGSHVVQQLAHAGVDTLLLVDDDLVAESNRGRVVGTRHDDDGKLKTEVMERLVKGIDPNIVVRAVPQQSSTAQGIAAIREADVVVACVDRFDARAEINALARRYLIPLIDIGMTLESQHEVLKSATGQATLTMPGAPCVRCTALVSDAALEQERRLAPPGYDRNPNAPGQAQVVSMNGLLASQAVTVVLAVLTGYTHQSLLGSGAWWQYDALEGQLDYSPITYRRPHCPGCSEEAQGDLWFTTLGERS